ncbi:MAG: hypothetical protein BAA03_11095 [Caldibacillus debilis]|nr:hypothetical protein [Bacillaceae bacterium]OUM91423.1 MAG: hypothetical protein BAA03_11095 [Caldibacillus debilis]
MDQGYPRFPSGYPFYHSSFFPIGKMKDSQIPFVPVHRLRLRTADRPSLLRCGNHFVGLSFFHVRLFFLFLCLAFLRDGRFFLYIS